MRDLGPVDNPPIGEHEERLFVVEHAILVRWPYGRGPEALTKAGWVRYTELTKFAFESMPVSRAMFALLRAQIFPAADLEGDP